MAVTQNLGWSLGNFGIDQHIAHEIIVRRILTITIVGSIRIDNLQSTLAVRGNSTFLNISEIDYLS